MHQNKNLNPKGFSSPLGVNRDNRGETFFSPVTQRRFDLRELQEIIWIKANKNLPYYIPYIGEKNKKLKKAIALHHSLYWSMHDILNELKG